MDRALTDHELIKVRARVGERDDRNAVLDTLAERTGSALVQRIGNVGLYYRRNRTLTRLILPD